MSTPIMFVSMPFGHRSGLLGHGEVEIDFDVVWKELFRPAAPGGWAAVRIDEVDEPGRISDQYLHYLQSAEVVVFDITFQNPNVLYELGLRHSFAKDKSILVAHEGTRLPFNLQQYRVLFYDFGERAGWGEFQARLRNMVESCARTPGVAGFMTKPDASQPAGASRMPKRPDDRRLERQLDRAENLPQLVAIWQQWKGWDSVPVDLLLKLGKGFLNERRTDLAVEVIAKAYQESPDEYEVARTYGWYLRKNNQLKEAEEKLREALRLNSGDVESKGMLGGLYKRQGRLDESYKQYLEAISIDANSVYHLVNLGALEALLHPETPDKSHRWYSRVIELCEPESASGDMPLWDRLALAEAYLATGMSDLAGKEYARVVEEGADLPMLQSAADQLEILGRAGFQAEACSKILSDILTPALVPSMKLGSASVKSGETGAGGARGSASRDLPIIIHISDIHFGYKTNKEGKRSPMHRFEGGVHNRPLAEHLVNEIERLNQVDGAKDRLVLVVSGDIAYEATAGEYKEAKAFVTEVLDKTGLHPKRLVMVPGNHDVSWTLSAHDRSIRFDEYLKFLYGVYGEPLFRQLYPHVTWDFSITKPRPKPADIMAVHEIPELSLIAVGFNSCVFEDEEKHYGLIGREQLERVSHRLSTANPQMLRVAVLHHHVIPVDNRLKMRGDEVAVDVSIVRDFGIVEEHLHRMGFDVVLHGHKHTPALRETVLLSSNTESEPAKRILVCGAGSTSVSYEELPPDSANHLEVLSFHSKTRIAGEPFVSVEWRELGYTDVAKWQTTRRWDIMG